MSKCTIYHDSGPPGIARLATFSSHHFVCKLQFALQTTTPRKYVAAMVHWVARILALILAIGVVAALFEVPGGARIKKVVVVPLLFAVASIWFSDEMATTTGKQVLYVWGWIILLLLAGVAVFIRVAA